MSMIWANSNHCNTSQRHKDSEHKGILILSKKATALNQSLKATSSIGPVAVALECLLLRTAGQVPELGRAVSGSGRDCPPVRWEGYRIDTVAVALKHLYILIPGPLLKLVRGHSFEDRRQMQYYSLALANLSTCLKIAWCWLSWAESFLRLNIPCRSSQMRPRLSNQWRSWSAQSTYKRCNYTRHRIWPTPWEEPRSRGNESSTQCYTVAHTLDGVKRLVTLCTRIFLPPWRWHCQLVISCIST